MLRFKDHLLSLRASIFTGFGDERWPEMGIRFALSPEYSGWIRGDVWAIGCGTTLAASKHRSGSDVAKFLITCHLNTSLFWKLYAFQSIGLASFPVWIFKKRSNLSGSQTWPRSNTSSPNKILQKETNGKRGDKCSVLTNRNGRAGYSCGVRRVRSHRHGDYCTAAHLGVRCRTFGLRDGFRTTFWQTYTRMVILFFW